MKNQIDIFGSDLKLIPGDAKQHPLPHPCQECGATIGICYLKPYTTSNGEVRQHLTLFCPNHSPHKHIKHLKQEKNMPEDQEEIKIYAKKMTAKSGTKYFFGWYKGHKVTIFNGNNRETGEQQLTVIIKHEESSRERAPRDEPPPPSDDDLPF